MKTIIDLNPDNPDGDKRMEIEETENYNFVSLKIGDNYYDVATVDLYRALMAYMDMREELRREND